MELPLVSLIIPMYNAEKYIEQCISCIRCQTYQNIEIVLIDDGSTDYTVKLCKQLIVDLPNVKMITTKNHGASAARNTGLDYARGEYVIFADVDDYFYEDYIEYLLKLVQKYEADIAVCRYEKKRDLEKIRSQTEDKEMILSFSSIEALENVSYRKEISAGPIAKLIRKEVTESVRFHEESAYWEDYLYVSEIIRNSEKIVYSNSVKYIYLQNGGSATHSRNCEKRVLSWEILMKKLSQYIQDYPEIRESFQAKALSASMDTLKGIYRSGYDETKIRQVVKKYTSSVVRDKKCTRLKRLLAFFTGINIDMTIWAGKFVLCLLSAVGLEI